MADGSGAEGDHDTDERPYTDVLHRIGVRGLDKRDHCDLLLDAIDAQLVRLQVQSPKHQTVSRENRSVNARLGWSRSLSKDTDLGSSQSNDIPMSCPDLMRTPTVRHSSEKSLESLLVNGETKGWLNRQAKGKEETEPQVEQVIWRLERLLGDACWEDGLAGEMHLPSDSICTEDFHRCFRDEMVEPALSETDIHQLDIEEAEGTEGTDSDDCQSEQKGRAFNFERGGSAVTHYSQSDMPHQRKEPEKYLPVGDGINISHVSERERYKRPQRSDDNTSTHRKMQNGRSSVHEVQCNKKEASRLGCSSGDNEWDTDERITLWNRRYQTNGVKNALQELERLATDTAQMEEMRTLECVLTDSREARDSISWQLQKLPAQTESFVLDHTEKEVDTLRQHKQTLAAGSCEEGSSIVMSVLEREEMERQLEKTKTELFAEQRRAREELESMQEKLEETCELLQRATEAEISLREKCSCLEEKQKQRKEQLEAVETRLRELHVELGECNVRLGSLEELLAQKKLQLINVQEQYGALQADRDELKVELQHLKTSYDKTLKEAQEQARRMTLKEEEAVQLRKSLEQHREEAKAREKQLHAEALEKVHKAIDEERRKWEAEKAEAVRVHCRILEEQNRKGLENMRGEMQREKSKVLAFQQQALKLKTKVQELESERCAQQREQESLLAGICKSLKEDHQAQLQRLQKDVAQESQRKVLRLEQAAQLAGKEAGRLRVMLEERESSHIQITAALDQQLRAWAQELGTECQHLYLLVEQCGAKQNALHLPLSPSVAEALANLRTLREQLKHWISHLHQELDSQKQTSEQLREDKERELSIQRQQLRVERDEALGFLKQRLVLEHAEELSRLSCVRVGGGTADGGVAQPLHTQHNAKDLELKGQWRGQPAARLASKFEEDLRAELQRKAVAVQRERRETTEGKITFSNKEAQISSSSSLCAVDSAASYSPPHTASFKLLSYLQSRVKQLRVENMAYTCGSAPFNADRTKITKGEEDIVEIRSQSPINVVSS